MDQEIQYIKQDIRELREILDEIRTLLRKNDSKMNNHISFIMRTYRTLEPVLNAVKIIVSPITLPIRWGSRALLPF